MPDTYRYLHIFISGFTQRWGRAGNGLHDVCDQVYRRYAAPDTLVMYFPWYINPADIAARIAELNEACLAAYGVPLQIQIVGYSFGGQTAANICRALSEIPDTPAVTVDRLCLCDAVARCGRLGWLRAANPFSKIVLPANVDRVSAFIQRHSRLQLRAPLFFPAGHRLFIERPVWIDEEIAIDQQPIEPCELDAQHTDVDNAEEFHTAVLSDAAEMHRGGGDVYSQVIPFPQAA